MKFQKLVLMQFSFIFFNKTALQVAIERGNPDIVKMILARPETDVNAKSILNNHFFLYYLNYLSLNYISNQRVLIKLIKIFFYKISNLFLLNIIHNVLLFI